MSQFGGGQFGQFGGGSTTVAPAAPGLSLYSIGNGEITLVYTASSGQTAGEIDFNDGTTSGTPVVTGATGTYVVSGLRNGVTYYFSARAQTNGSWSAPSLTVLGTPTAGGFGAIDNSFEACICLSLAQEIRGNADLAAFPLQVFGVRTPVAEDAITWLSLDVLSFHRTPSRSGVWKGVVLFQVGVFSRDAAERMDRMSMTALSVAGIVARSLEQKHILIQSFAETPWVNLADMAIREPKMISIPPMEGENVWMVAVSFDGYIMTS